MLQPNIYHFKYYTDAINLGGIAAAAKKNNVSQSAVSQAIKGLENSFNCQLLIHKKNHFVPSPEGRIIAKRIEKILESVANLHLEVAEINYNVSGPLNVATLRSLALVLLSKPLRSIQENHKKLEPIMKIGHTNSIVEMVQSGAIEIGVVVDNKAINNVQKYILHEGHFKCVVSPEKKHLIKNLGFLTTEEKPGELELKKAFNRHFKRKAQVAMIIESWDVIAKFAAEGLGIGLIPDFVVNSLTHYQLTEVYSQFASQMKYKIIVVHNGIEQLSPGARLFIEELDRFSGQILANQ